MKNFFLLTILLLFSFSADAGITFGGSAVQDGQIVFGDEPQTLTVTLDGANAGAATQFDLFTNLSPAASVYNAAVTPVAGGLFKTVTFTVSTLGNGGDVEIDPATAQFFLTFANSAGSPLEGIAVNSILPVEFTDFTAKSNKNAVALTWTTAMELNNDYFTVERSFDGHSYEAVSKIAGAGDSEEEIIYDYTDETVMRAATANTVYYRLKQTDFDGAFAYSDVITVDLENRLDLELTNVAVSGDNLTVNYNMPTDNDTEITVLDMSGRMVASSNTFSNEGFNNAQINLSNVGSGIYIVRLTDGRKQTVRKFVK